MTSAKYDVLAIGNALFDVLVRAEDDFLVKHGMAKGGMALIDEARAAAIYADMGQATEMSGGSAANTIVGLASFGARTAYVGKVKDDQIGKLYSHDIRAAGVAFDTQAGRRRPGHRLLLHPGDAGRRAHHEHVSGRGAGSWAPTTSTPSRSRPPRWSISRAICGIPANAKEAFLKASQIAHGAGRQVALTLSDAFCVDRYRAEFLDLMRSGTVDLIFANESELHSLYQTSDFDTALNQLQNDIALGVVTRSEKGCAVVVERRGDAGAGVADRDAGRHHRRGRPVRRRLPVRAGARCGL